MRDIKKILIANRGEIACRIINSCKKLKFHSIAVYSDVDKNSKHVKKANESIHIGGSTAQDSYLSSDKINIFLDDYEISFNDVTFNEEEMVFKGNPIYLIDKNGLKTTTSLIKLKSNGELIFPNKMN